MLKQHHLQAVQADSTARDGAKDYCRHHSQHLPVTISDIQSVLPSTGEALYFAAICWRGSLFSFSAIRDEDPKKPTID